jgi:hypothetical protein
MAARNAAHEGKHPRRLRLSMRWMSLGVGAALVATAFFAASRVADTREGLIYEVVTLLSGLVGVSLLLYAFVARGSRSMVATPTPARVDTPKVDRVHSADELLMGAGGLVLGALLVTGLALSGGTTWALIGLVALLPMIAGCAYLCYGFVRGPKREWRIDLLRLTGRHR